jgi:hypothetical protein
MKGLTITQMIKLLQEAKKNYGNLPCCTSIDDEGNGYTEVIFAPSPMKMMKHHHAIELEWEHLKEGEKETNPNYICIN